jgi:hypothetical protein
MVLNDANLHAELTVDPKSIGFAPLLVSGDDTEIANLLNATTGPGIGIVPHEPIAPNDFIALLDPNELDSLTALQLAQIQVYEAAGEINFGSPNVQQWLNKVFDNASFPVTHSNLDALFNRTASRAEVLFGAGVVINSSQVATAREYTGA